MGVNEKARITIERILYGSVDDFEIIVTEYKSLVFHVVRSMLADNSVHEDIAQDIFVKVYESLPGFQFRCGLATWISRIAYNTCLNHLRRIKSHPQNNPEHRVEEGKSDEINMSYYTDYYPAESRTPHAVISRKEMEATIRESISRLPVQYRLIIILYYMDGFSVSELAETLGMPAGTIKSHLFRARALLKSDLLKKYNIEDLL